jgi:pimeloyl-ACP methyl ester carboxylesterase
MPEVERLWTSADGLSLFARDYAPGPGPARAPVICLHGLTRNSRDFEVVAPHIAGATGRRVLALDMRGRGRSAYDPNPANYIPPVYAADVAALMAQAAISKAMFIGTSMGGLITLALSAMRPDLAAGAVINDVGPEIAPEGVARIGAYVGRAGPVADWAEAEAYTRQTNGFALPHLTDADWAAFTRRIFREDASGRPALDYDPAISQAFKAPVEGTPAAPAPDLWPMFAALAKDRPTLLVRGEASDLLSPGIAARMRAAAPTMREVTLPGVGHAPTLEEPPVMAAILALLADAP